MTNLSDLTIETDRLRLAPTSPEFAQAIFAVFSDRVTRFMFPKPASDISETLAFIEDARRRMAKGEDYQCAILLKEGDEFIGHGGVHGLHNSSPELGIWIKEDAWAHGYGREAVFALVRWAFEEGGFESLIYPVDRRNVPSRRIPEALGGSVWKEYKVVNAAGRDLDIVEYVIARSESDLPT